MLVVDVSAPLGTANGEENEKCVGLAFLVILVHSMEKGISDGNAWEGAGVSQWQ